MPKTARKMGVRVLAEDVANKIAAGEVVERPASVVKELIENALDAGATRISVRIVGAGRRLIEVTDNGCGMSEQDALLAIERHATSKIRRAEDLDNIDTLGFRGEALPSMASVSRFEMVTRTADAESATRVRIEGGILRDVVEASGSPGTRISVHRLYFNTPVRAKFLKGVTTELSHCIDIVQRHALASPGVAFQFEHNDKILLDIPGHAGLKERVALIWGLGFAGQMVEISGEHGGFRLSGLIGSPSLNRSSRSHQFFFMNGRPVVNRSLQYGFEDGYHGLLTVGRHPVGVLMLEAHPRLVDVNIHPTKREIRFRDDRLVRDAVRALVRLRLESLHTHDGDAPAPRSDAVPVLAPPVRNGGGPGNGDPHAPANVAPIWPLKPVVAPEPAVAAEPEAAPPSVPEPAQTEFSVSGIEPIAVYRSVEELESVAMQLFDTYLLIPEEDRLLIIDQHALHERLNYDVLRADLADRDYHAQQLAVPILIEVAPAQAKLLDANPELFSQLGVEIEPFGGTTYQVTAICHLYDEAHIADTVYRVLDELAQGDLFDREEFMADLLRLALQACKASVRAGDRLSDEEKGALISGFRRMKPPYTCPHGRPIITELTQTQMEKSFRRRQ